MKKPEQMAMPLDEEILQRAIDIKEKEGLETDDALKKSMEEVGLDREKDYQLYMKLLLQISGESRKRKGARFPKKGIETDDKY